MPTRLLDIGIDGDHLWKLHITAETPIISHNYITLSYRWGTSQALTLTGTNIEELRRGKPIGELPLTFRDAVTVARRLSIRYLWIDSLCIVQDSPEDWATESVMMRHVYANSACNISAAASLDPHGGLFRERKLVDVQPGVLRLNKRWYSISDEPYWERWVSHTPLHRRGWVFQERLLAPRILHFTEKQIFWECFTEKKCEAYPFPRIAYTFHKNIDPLIMAASSRHPWGSLNDSQFMMWTDLVSEYSQCAVTEPADKLVAFEGVANLFQEFTGDEYLAGLWRSRLCECLGWGARDDTKNRRPTHYRAPSWSWASIDGEVYPNWLGSDAIKLIQVLDACIISFSPSSERYADEVPDKASPGFISLKGFIAQCTSIRSSRSDHYMRRITAVNEFRAMLMRDALPVMDGQGSDSTEGTIIHCLALSWSFSKSPNTWLSGLILEPLPRSPHAYTRIGHFNIYGKENIENFGISFDEDNRSVRPFSSEELSEIKIF